MRKIIVRSGPNNLGRMHVTLHMANRTHLGTSSLVVDCELGPARTWRTPSQLCGGSRSKVISPRLQDREYTSLPSRISSNKTPLAIKSSHLE